MKKWKKITLWTFGTFMLVVLALSALVFRSMRPTTGPRIGDYPSPRTALLVVDIQEDYTGPQARMRFRDGDRIVAVSNELLAQAEARGVVVVFVENVIDNPILSVLTRGINAPGSPGTEMDRRLAKVPGTRTFSKRRSDAFSNPELDAFLRERQVNRVVLVGLDAAHCVNATAQGALNRGYGVTLFLDGLATESSKSIDELARGWRAKGAEVRTGTQL